VIYVRDLPVGGGWRDILLADTTRAGYTTVYFAREGRILVDRDKQQVHIRLTEGTSHTTAESKPEWSESSRFDSVTLGIDRRSVFPEPPSRGVPEMRFNELREAIARAAARGEAATQERFMWSYKFALPVTCLILGFIALALGATNRKDGRFASFAVGLSVVLVYYVLLYGARSVALGGRLNPGWAPWIPNIVMATAAAIMVVWRARWADQPLRLNVPMFWRRPADPTPEGRTSASTPHPRPRPVLVIRLPRLNLPFPRLLDMYIGRDYLRMFLLGVLSLLAMFYISTFIDLVDKLFRGDTTTAMLLSFFYYKTPQFLYYVIPMGVLVSTLVTVGVMTKNNELMVMRACGISLYRTAAPLLVFALAGSVLLYAVQERILAHTAREADRLERIIRKWPALSSPLDRRWAIGADGSVYHYSYFDPDTNRFSQLHVYRLDEPSWTLRRVTYARDAVPVRQADAAEDASILWTLRDGWEREVPAGLDSATAGQQQAAMKYAPFAQQELSLEPPKYFKTDSPDADMMTYGQLQDFIARQLSSGADASRYMVGLQRKIAFPLVTVVMTMLAVPFAVATGRRGALYGVGAAIVIAIVYYIAQSVFGAFGAGGLLPPTLAAWAPNLMFSALAIYFILTVRT
jgi:LPS export ABC transporter permease LptG